MEDFEDFLDAYMVRQARIIAAKRNDKPTSWEKFKDWLRGK